MASTLNINFEYVRQVDSKPAANAVEAGNILYDRTENKFYRSNGSVWNIIGSTVLGSPSINELIDVDTSGTAANYVLFFNASASVWEATSISSLETFSSAGDITAVLGDMAVKNSVSGSDIETRTISGTDIALNTISVSNLDTFNVSDLSDVTITTISSSEILKWNGSAWINNTLPEAGIAAEVHTHTESDITDLQSYLLNITGEPLSDLNDVTITSVSSSELLSYDGSGWVNQTLTELDVATLTSPAFTGTPTAPTATSGTNTTQIATTAFVQSAIIASSGGDMLKSVYDTDNDGVVDSAETLSGLTATITELNYTDGVTSSIQTQLNGKVDENASITPGTNTKITFDAKGLVTSGSNISSSDLPTVDVLKFNTSYSGTSASGEVAWNIDEETLDLQLASDVVLQVGQEMMYHVINQTGSSISNGTVVMADGTLGASGKIKVTPAVADGTVPGKYIMGVATEDIANGAEGYVTAFGKVRGVNTSAFSNGDVLYADPSTPGGLTTTVPTAPEVHVTVAIVINAATNGTLFVRPSFGSSLNADDAVNITSVADHDILYYDSATSVWVNGSFSDVGVAAAVHTHTESDITDLGSYIENITGEPLSDLNDVTITSIGSGEVLKWNGSAWVNNTLSESDITDLGAYIENITGEPLSDLNDVIITSISSGEILKWNGSAWVNNTFTEAGIASLASPTFTGTPAAPTAASGTNTTQIATTQFVQNTVAAAGGGDMLAATYDSNSDGKVDAADYADTLSGLTTTVSQLNNLSALTASRVVVTNASGNLTVSGNITPVELNYLNGVSSNIQTQLDAKLDANTPITGATNTKITFDNDGLVTAGSNLSASDIPNLSASKITTGIFNAARIPSLDASKITTGTLNSDRVPSLSASKITTGTLNSDRIPNLSASKITTGTLSSDRVPSLSASKITTGTFNTARIPNLDASKITTGAFDTARIPSLDASKITTGTFDNARISVLNVTQHEASLSITESQISDFDDYLPLSGGALTGPVTFDSDGQQFEFVKTAGTNRRALDFTNGTTTQWTIRHDDNANLDIEKLAGSGYVNVSNSDLYVQENKVWNDAQVVTSIAALKALTAGVYKVVYLQDTNTGTTGGRSGWFEWDSTDHSTATGTGFVSYDPENGVYVPPNSDTTGASGAWRRRYVGAVNVDWFGAVPDNNYASPTINSVTGINAAINFITSAGFRGEVEFSRGRYTINSPILIKESVRIRGNGIQSTQIKLANNANCNMIELSSTSDQFTGVYNLTLDGNKLYNSTGSGIYYVNGIPDALLYTDAIHEFDNLIITSCAEDGMYLSANSRETKASRIYSVGNDRYGYNLQNTDSLFDRCVAASSGNHGFYLRGPNTRFVNCKAFGSGKVTSTGSNGSGFFLNFSRITLVGCDAQENLSHGFVILNSNHCNLVGCVSDANDKQGFRIDNAEFCNVTEFLAYNTSGLAYTHNMGIEILSTAVKNRLTGILDLPSTNDYNDFAASGSNIVEFMLRAGTVYTDSP